MRYLVSYRIWCVVATVAALVAGRNDSRAELVADPWSQLPQLLAEIKAPTFPDRDFAVTDFGAKADGKFDCKPAIDAAIAKCHAEGGGRVVVPAGRWFHAGPIHLKSNVNVHVSEGATILFSNDPKDYLPPVLTRFEGTECMNYSPLVYAFEQENIAITGKGTLDGQASREKWWPWKGRTANGPNQQNAIAALGKMGDEGVPPEQRVFGEGHQLRPNFVQPYRSKNVLIEGVTLNNSPMWNLNPVLCTNVTVRGVTVDSHGPNNDGCNPESCRNVLIEDCTFDTGDDCIAIKSGRNADGRRIGVPSENIVVRNCNMRDGHGGVVLGSEMSGGIRNVFVENCHMDSPQLDRAIRLKSNSIRGGYLENLFVRNIEVGQVSDAVLRINLEYWNESGDFPPTVRNIYLENVTSKKSKHPLYLVGLPEHPIENVHLKNCWFAGAERPSIIEHVADLQMQNVGFPREGTERPAVVDAKPQAGSGRVSFTKEDDGVTVNVDGKLFTRYIYKWHRRPIMWPVIASSGVAMTRSYPMGEPGPSEASDHIHHQSVWFGYEGLNGVDFWQQPEEGVRRPYPGGIVDQQEVVRLEKEGDTLVLATRNAYLDPEGQPVCHDERQVTFGAEGDNRWIDFRIKLMALDDKPLEILDTKEGAFACRVAGTMKVDAKKGGYFVNDQGEKNGQAWGKPAKWVDYVGPVEGQTMGIAIFTHPEGYNPKPRWHVREYGLFAANPFGVKPYAGRRSTETGGLKIPAGESVSLRYRMVIHPGDTESAHVAEMFAKYSGE